MAITDYLELIAQRVQDTDSRLMPDNFSRALRSAVIKYSQDKPRQQVTDVMADGSSTLPLPIGFDTAFSSIASIEHPIGDFPLSQLENDEWLLMQTPTGSALRLSRSISAGNHARISWTQLHTLSDTEDTIPAVHLDAVSDWASSLLCHDLATLYSGDSDPTITADSVDHNGKAREFAARARTLAQRYYDAIGVDPKRNAAAMVVVDLDTRGAQGGARLTHRRRYY